MFSFFAFIESLPDISNFVSHAEADVIKKSYHRLAILIKKAVI